LLRDLEFAEQSGFDYFWYGNEKLGPDMWVGLAAAAVLSHSIRLGTFVVDPYSQHPALTAAMIATLDHYCDGRAVLAMGAGGSGLRELGITRDRPRENIEQAVGLIRSLLQGEAAVRDGPLFSVAGELHFPPCPALPIWIATRGTGVLELSGRIADGVMIGTIARPADLRTAREIVARGAAAAGRTLRDLSVSARVDVAIADASETARGAVRAFVVSILSASFPDRGFLTRAGLEVPPELEAVCRTKDLQLARRSGDLVPDELVDFFSWAGTPEEVAVRVAETIDLGVDNVTVAFHPSARQPLEQVKRFVDEVIPRASAMLGTPALVRGGA
jgi:5,10-methylenetetrahydromethanopterin reductase